jgi:TPR repeat protein
VQQGKYDEAFPILKKSAELGNAEAQYNLGYFLNGNDLTVYNLTMTPINIGENLFLNVGINIEISCDG